MNEESERKKQTKVKGRNRRRIREGMRKAKEKGKVEESCGPAATFVTFFVRVHGFSYFAVALEMAKASVSSRATRQITPRGR